MSLNTKIEWTHHSLNLWHGCVKISNGCTNCYAEVRSHRFGDDIWGDDKPRKRIKSVWDELDKAQRKAAAANEMHTVFMNSMSDIFEKSMPVIDHNGNQLSTTTGYLRFELFQRIEEKEYENLIFLFLTKRPSNIQKFILPKWIDNPPKNVMYGLSLVEQDEHLLKQFMKVKGKKFLSIEPQLEHIDLTQFKQCVADGFFGDCLQWYHAPYDPDQKLPEYPVISWIINGGESGHHRRPFDLDWAYSLKQQCADAGVPYFFKQIDKIKQIPDDLMVRQFPSYFSDLNYFKQ